MVALLEIFLVVNAAVFSYAWENKFILVWQWGIPVMFAGIALMLWGVITAWVDRQISADLEGAARAACQA